MDIHGKSVDMDMDINGKFHIHGKPGTNPYPSMWHATLASLLSNQSSHTVPQMPPMLISRRPARVLLPPPTSRTDLTSTHKKKCRNHLISSVNMKVAK